MKCSEFKLRARILLSSESSRINPRMSLRIDRRLLANSHLTRRPQDSRDIDSFRGKTENAGFSSMKISRIREWSDNSGGYTEIFRHLIDSERLKVNASGQGEGRGARRQGWIAAKGRGAESVIEKFPSELVKTNS